MRLADERSVADRATDLLHLDTQAWPFGIDLTVREVRRIMGRGSLDFGGSEFREAPSEAIEPVKRERDDDYGWWALDRGTYLVRFNEGVDLEDGELGLVQPHPRLMRAGAHHASFALFGHHEQLATLLEVGDGGCDLKENCRISRLMMVAP